MNTPEDDNKPKKDPPPPPPPPKLDPEDLYDFSKGYRGGDKETDKGKKEQK